MSSLSAKAHCKAALAAAFLASTPTPALALTPTEVFEQASPSIWAVRALDAQERPIRFGSAVVIGPGQLATRCHVLARARSLQLRRENTIFEARLENADVERDLCILSASNFHAPTVLRAPFNGVKVGQRVYVIGNPERLAASLSEGLVAGVRNEDGKPALHTTAPLSAGLSGGGVFDERGMLVGIAAFGSTGARSASLAVPADWIAEVPERAKELLARRVESPAAAPAASQPGLPPVGATWRYGFRDRQYASALRVFTVRVSGIQGGQVHESFSVENGQESNATVEPESIRFSARRLTSDYAAIELAPYFYSSERWRDAAAPRPSAYPGNAAWEIAPAQVQLEDISVPAGTFKAVRVDVRGSAAGHGSAGMSASANHFPARFHFTGWYAPEVGRYVMTRHQTYNLNNTQIGDEVVQLLEYRTK